MRTVTAFELGVLLARNSAGMQKLAQNPTNPPVPKPPQPQSYYNPTRRNLSGPELAQMYQNLDSKSPQWLQNMVQKQNPALKDIQNVRFVPRPYPNQPIPQGQNSYMSASRVPVNPYYDILGDRGGVPYRFGSVQAPNIYTNANLNPSNVEKIMQGTVPRLAQ